MNPSHLHIENESPKHAGHQAMQGVSEEKKAETHFKVLVVSDAFEGVPLLERHRMINNLVENQFEIGLHALSI